MSSTQWYRKKRVGFEDAQYQNNTQRKKSFYSRMGDGEGEALFMGLTKKIFTRSDATGEN